MNKFENIIADLEGWQTQLAARAVALKEDQDAFNKLKASIRETVTCSDYFILDETERSRVLHAPKTTRRYKKSNLPSSATLRPMVYKVLSGKKRVPMRELLTKIHETVGLDMPAKVGDSELTNRIYAVVSGLRVKKLVKVFKRVVTVTPRGLASVNRKHWSLTV